MSELKKIEEVKLPTIQDLHYDREVGFKQDSLNWLLNQKVPEAWVKTNSNIPYLPIDKVEYLLTKIFGTYEVMVIDYKQLANSITVHVRLIVTNPINGERITQDGLGAVPIQVNSGESASNLAAIKADAIKKGLPSAESYAIKDAAQKLGQIFGGNLTRKDVIQPEPSEKIKSRWKLDTI